MSGRETAQPGPLEGSDDQGLEVPFGEWVADNYERLWPDLHRPEVIEPTVDFLAGLAGGGSALEFGIGTGRLAVPLARRGFRVHGIELSEAMADRARQNAEGTDVEVSLGDFSTTRVGSDFDLVYLVRNTITNLTTQDGQVAAFQNAAHHLRPGGHFVIENYIPTCGSSPPERPARSSTPPPTTWGSANTTSPPRPRHHITGGGSTEACGRCLPGSATCGRVSSTSWPTWPVSSSSTDGPTGTGQPSTARAGATSPYGKSQPPAPRVGDGDRGDATQIIRFGAGR